MRTSIPLSDCLSNGRREPVSDVYLAQFRDNLRGFGPLLLRRPVSINRMLNGRLSQRVIHWLEKRKLAPLCRLSS